MGYNNYTKRAYYLSLQIINNFNLPPPPRGAGGGSPRRGGKLHKKNNIFTGRKAAGDIPPGGNILENKIARYNTSGIKGNKLPN